MYSISTFTTLLRVYDTTKTNNNPRREAHGNSCLRLRLKRSTSILSTLNS